PLAELLTLKSGEHYRLLNDIRHTGKTLEDDFVELHALGQQSSQTRRRHGGLGITPLEQRAADRAAREPHDLSEIAWIATGALEQSFVLFGSEAGQRRCQQRAEVAKRAQFQFGYAF